MLLLVGVELNDCQNSAFCSRAPSVHLKYPQGSRNFFKTAREAQLPL